MDATDGVDPDAGGERAEGGAQAGRGWDEHVADVERLGDLTRVGGAGSAEGDQGMLSWVGALLDGQDPDRVRHVLVADPHHGGGGLELGVLEPLSQSSEGAGGERPVERELAAEEECGIEPAEHEVRIGDRRLLAAAPVAGRSRDGACALRPDLEEAAGVDPSDRAAARPDRPRRDARHADREAELELEVGRIERLALEDHADVAARSAHVECERTVHPRSARDVGPTDATACDSGQEQVRRAGAGLGRNGATAVRLQERPPAARSGLLRGRVRGRPRSRRRAAS